MLQTLKSRPALLAALAVLVLVGAGVAWYLGSPLFINRAVDEAFPFMPPAPATVAVMSEAEKKQMEAEFMAAVPSEEVVANMPEQTRKAVEERVMEAAALMPDHEMAEDMPEEAEPAVILRGEFRGADSFHMGSGTASIYRLPDGSHVLRFEDFSVTNGPDLRVLLAAGRSPASHAELGDMVELAVLKGNIGNQNYDIPASIDLSQYQSVVIYCKPFRVIFAVAALAP